MSLLRLNRITTKAFIQGRLVLNIQSVAGVRRITSDNGKSATNPGLVNKNNNQRAKKQNRTEDEPALTIYPREKLDFLKKPKIELKTGSVKVGKNTKIATNPKTNDLNKDKSTNNSLLMKEDDKIPTNKPIQIKQPPKIIPLKNSQIEKSVVECVKNPNAMDEKIFCKIPENLQKQQSKMAFTSPIIREVQTQSGPSGSGKSPEQPPSGSSSSGNQTLWIGAAAALLLGGGAFFIFKSKSGTHDGSASASQKAAALRKPKVPATSAEIPKEVPYLLIGGGTASFAAFRAIKSHEPKAKIMVLSHETETPYMRPPLSKELWLADSGKPKIPSKQKETESLKFKQWNGVERSLYYEPEDFYIHPTKLLDEPNGGVAIVRGYTVKKVDVQNRTAILTDGTEIKYNKCLIATGSRPKTLPEFETASPKIQEHVSLFKTIEDYGSLKRSVDNSKTVAIIGGGFLGSELACALAKYGESRKLQVHQIFHEQGNMGKVLPEYLSKWTSERVREEGVNIIPNTHVKGVELVNKQLKLKLNNGESVICDHAIVAVGSEPNVDLAIESSLEVDTVHGGYLVNAELEARNNLYVAGDAACFYDPRLGRRRVEHHDHAVVSGRLAGENMVGLHKPYEHQSMFWSDLGPKIGYEAIGIADSTLPTVSVFVKPEPQKPKEGSLDLKADSLTPAVQAATNDEVSDDFSIGVFFYLRDDKIVGIVLWNVFNRINTARAVISQDKKYDDLNEVAKLFDIHA